MCVERGQLVAIEGPNGSGKSTLAQMLAGTPPTSGTIERPGGVGIGAIDGTAIVFQRPETQVLGMRVRDDVMWGLEPGRRPDVERELARVGLDGFADRDTSTLSGGELQRLALAAALAHRPALLISDETTAMIDADGRSRMLELFGELRDDGLSVVHVSHRPEETAAADRVVHLQSGRRVSGQPVRREQPVNSPAPYAALSASGPLITLRNVGHVYDAGSPWARRALEGIDLDIRPREGLLIHGPNGSGKSTLAWILAGLLAPTEGTAFLGGIPLWHQLDQLGLSFQHARLQLQRRTVLADVRAAAGATDEAAERALAAMGLDPNTYRDRGIDELSGGQQRRVALAGLLAANPSVIVLDEPFAGLDQTGRAELIETLVGLRRDGTTVVLVSHDLEDTDAIADHTVALEAGRITSDSRPPDLGHPVATESPNASGARRGVELRLFRMLPSAGPLHRVWPGTKVLGLVALAAFVSLDPQWPSIIATAAAVLAGLFIGRVPRNAAPRLPRWVVIALAVGLMANLVAGGQPDLHLGPLTIGLGAAGNWLRATTLGATVFTAAALVSWTTPLADVTPALHHLTRPLARLHLPIEYWATVLALGLRGLPMLLDEMQTLVTARRMRAAHAPPPSSRWRHQLPRTSRCARGCSGHGRPARAGEFADAMDARGGAHTVADQAPSLSYRDAVVALTIVATIGIGLLGTVQL